MKILMAFLFAILLSTVVLADNMITGTVFDGVTAQRIYDARIKVTCKGFEGYGKTDNQGNYKFWVDEYDCPKGYRVSVKATKDLMYGENTGEMKKILVLNIATIDVFLKKITRQLLSSIKGERKEITIPQVQVNPYVHAGEIAVLDVQARSSKSIKDVSITAFIQELDAFGRKTIDHLNKRGREQVYLPIPMTADPGEYTVRIEAYNGQARIVKYVPLEII